MTRIKNPYDLIIGKTYKIIFPCYDDYNEDLKPEINVVTISSKNKNGLIALNMNNDSTYELKYKILYNCEIYSL